MDTTVTFTTDPFGAPLLVAFDVGFAVHLTPVTRAQLRTAEARADAQDFAEVLAASEGFCAEAQATETPEAHFALGVLPEEAERFAEVLTHAGGPGETYVVPTLAQWKALHRDLAARFPANASGRLAATEASPDALALSLAHWRSTPPPMTWADALLLTGGLVEWVREGAHYAGMGAPRSAFYPNLYRPPETIVRPIRPDQRMRPFGFRCVRPL